MIVPSTVAMRRKLTCTKKLAKHHNAMATPFCGFILSLSPTTRSYGSVDQVDGPNSGPDDEGTWKMSFPRCFFSHFVAEE